MAGKGGMLSVEVILPTAQITRSTKPGTARGWIVAGARVLCMHTNVAQVPYREGQGLPGCHPQMPDLAVPAFQQEYTTLPGSPAICS